MAKMFPIQNRFSAGEISPRLYSRSDIEGYASGVKTLANFVSLRHGSIARRPGTRMVSIHPGYTGRMFEFPISDTESYAVVLTNEGLLYVDDRQGNLYGNNLGVNPDFRGSLDGWIDGATGLGHTDYIGGEVSLATGGTGPNDTASLSQTVSIVDQTKQHLMRVVASSLLGNTGLHVKVGTQPGAGEYLDVQMDPGQTDLYFDLNLDADIRVTDAEDPRVTDQGDQRIPAPISAAVTGIDVYVSIELLGAGAEEEPEWIVDHVSFHERFGVHDEVALPHPYDAQDLIELQFCMEPGENKAHLVTGLKIPYTLDYNDGDWTLEITKFSGRPKAWNGYIDFITYANTETPAIGAVILTPSGDVYRFKGTETNLSEADYTSTGWTDLGISDIYDDPIDFDTDAGTRYLGPLATVEVLDPYEDHGGEVGHVYQWAGTTDMSGVATSPNWEFVATEETYLANPNFPGSVGFFGGRSWWAGFPENQDTLNASKSNEYTDLGIGRGLDSDGIEATMSDHGLIQWIRGEQDLLIGSKNGEYVVTSEGGPITPSDIQINKQSNNGSRKMQPEPIGNSVAYTSLDGAKISDMQYKFVVNGWQSLDISFTAEHMFSLYGKVKEIHYAKDPASIIWFVTEEGNLIGCTFDEANSVIGWHRHPTDGHIISACIQRHKGVATIWLLIDRHISDTKQLYVERQAYTEFVDSSSLIYYEFGTNLIQGFKHLAGKTVSVRVDGVSAGQITLDENGDGTSLLRGKLIEVGLPYTATMVTLPDDTPIFRTGTAMGHLKRYNRICARLYSSFIPLVNGVRPTQHKNSLLTEPYSGDVDVVTLGWDTFAENTIEMELPYPCNISGIYGELEENLA